jgi:hypothetical protein
MTAVREEPPSFLHLLPTDAKVVLTDYLVHDLYTQDTLPASMEALFPVSMYPCDYAKRLDGICSCRFCVVENARLKSAEEKKRRPPHWREIAQDASFLKELNRRNEEKNAEKNALDVPLVPRFRHQRKMHRIQQLSYQTYPDTFPQSLEDELVDVEHDLEVLKGIQEREKERKSFRRHYGW